MRNWILLLSLLVFAFPIVAQDQKVPDGAVEIASVPVLKVPPYVEGSENQLALARVNTLVQKRALAEANYKLTVQEANRLQEEYAKLSDQINAGIKALYAELKLNPKEYDIDMDTGKITPQAKK